MAEIYHSKGCRSSPESLALKANLNSGLPITIVVGIPNQRIAYTLKRPHHRLFPATSSATSGGAHTDLVHLCPQTLSHNKRPSRTDSRTSTTPISRHHTGPLLGHGWRGRRRRSRRSRRGHGRRCRHDRLTPEHGDRHVEDVQRLGKQVLHLRVAVDGRELAGDGREEGVAVIADLLQDVGHAGGKVDGVEEGFLRQEVVDC